MSSNRLEPRPVEELLADAERYERWAARTHWNEEISSNFQHLAEEARARAARKSGTP
jgi:hypothetical protein